MKKILFILIIAGIIACGEKQQKAEQLVTQDSARVKKDTTRYPQKPKGYKSAHQEQMEEHAGEKSKIK